MSTLQQIEQLLLPVWNKLYKEKPDKIPKSFIRLMTYIIPKYKDFNFDTFLGKLNRKIVTNALRKCQIDLLELNLLDKNTQNVLSGLINVFNLKKIIKEYKSVGEFIGKVLGLVIIKEFKPNGVYLVQENGIERVLKIALWSNSGHIYALKREAEFLNDLKKQKNFPKLIRVYQQRNFFAILKEYITGKTLSETKLTQKQAEKLKNAVLACHQKGYAKLTLFPDSIIVRKEDNEPFFIDIGDLSVRKGEVRKEEFNKYVQQDMIKIETYF